MYQIYDCTGKAIGRVQGYKRHSTAKGLAARSGAINRAIYEAVETAKAINPSHNLLYRIGRIAHIVGV